MEILIFKNQNILRLIISCILLSLLSTKTDSLNMDKKIKDLCKPANDPQLCFESIKKHAPKDVESEKELNPKWAVKMAVAAAKEEIKKVVAFAEKHLKEKPEDTVLSKCKAAYENLAKSIDKRIPKDLLDISEKASDGETKLKKECNVLLSGKHVKCTQDTVKTLEKSPGTIDPYLKNVAALADEADLLENT